MIENIAKNSFRAWLLATRPKTLMGAAVPVCVATAWACAHTNYCIAITPTLLCLLFALVMQVDANFINDYFDCLKGNDDETRLGPKRACSQGWISLHAMKWGIFFTTILASVIGLPLIYYGGIKLIIVGMLCIIFCFLYTTHLSYKGLGDVLVIIFFGFIPLLATYYLAMGTNFVAFNAEVVMSGFTCGLVTDLLLVVNNHRDIENDLKAGKITLSVRLGVKRSLQLYGAIGFVVCLLGCVFIFTQNYLCFVLPLLFLVPHTQTFKQMKRINKGKELNLILGKTARNIAIYGLLLIVAILLSTL